MLSPEVNVSASSESNLVVAEVIEELLKRPSYKNNDLFSEQKCSNQLSLTFQEIVAVRKECTQNRVDSGAKYTAKNSTESAIEKEELIVCPELQSEIKVKPKCSMNQQNNEKLKLFDKNNVGIIKNYLTNSTEFSQIEQDKMPNCWNLTSKCNKLKDSIFLQDNVSKLLYLKSNEVSLQKMFWESSKFESKPLFNTNTNLSLTITSCTMNLFNELGETLSHKQSAENCMMHKLLLSDLMKAESLARKVNFLSSRREDTEVKGIAVSAPQNESNKLLLHSDTQIQSCVFNNNTFNNYTAVNVSDQTLKLELSADYKSLTKLITNSFVHKVSLESFIAGVSDCTTQSDNCSLGNITAVQYSGSMKDIFDKKLPSSNNYNLKPSFKDVDKFDDNSCVHSKVNQKLSTPSKSQTSIHINKTLVSEHQLFDNTSNTNIYVSSDLYEQLEDQSYPTTAHLSKLLERKSKYPSRQKVPMKSLINTSESNGGILNTHDLSRKGALTCLNKEAELSDNFKCNKVEFSFSSSGDLTSNRIAYSKKSKDKAIQFDSEPLHIGNFDADIDKAIDESMNKYEHFMCDKGVLATPDSCDKSSQTDNMREGQLSCKRCLKFDGEDLRPIKRTKTYHKDSEESNLSVCEPVCTNPLTELLLYGIKHDSSSNLTPINVNDCNKCKKCNDDFDKTNNMLKVISKDSSLMHTDMKDNIKIYTWCGKNNNVTDEFSLYDEELDIEDGLNWSKDPKDIHESDHKVPVAEGEVASSAFIRSTSSFPNTPKKPILKVGLSRSARLKPLHQK